MRGAATSRSRTSSPGTSRSISCFVSRLHPATSRLAGRRNPLRRAASTSTALGRLIQFDTPRHRALGPRACTCPQPRDADGRPPRRDGRRRLAVGLRLRHVPRPRRWQLLFGATYPERVAAARALQRRSPTGRTGRRTTRCAPTEEEWRVLLERDAVARWGDQDVRRRSSCGPWLPSRAEPIPSAARWAASAPASRGQPGRRASPSLRMCDERRHPATCCRRSGADADPSHRLLIST